MSLIELNSLNPGDAVLIREPLSPSGEETAIFLERTPFGRHGLFYKFLSSSRGDEIVLPEWTARIQCHHISDERRNTNEQCF